MKGRCPRCGWADGLTVTETAARLGVSDQTVRNYIKEGRLPGTVTERTGPSGLIRYVVPVEAVEALEKEREAVA